MQNFGLTFDKYLRENLKSLILKICGLFAVLAMIALWIGYVYNTEEWDYTSLVYDRAHMREVGFFSFLLVLISMVCASDAMSIMSSKEKRLSTLMTPSTMLSKFVTVWIVNVPLPVAVFVLFGYAADFLRYLVYLPFAHSGDVRPISLFDLGIPTEVINVFFMMIVIGQSLFMLGGTVWSKRPTLKTVVALALICIVYTMLAKFGHILALKPGYFWFSFSDAEPQIWVCWIITAVISAGIYALSYFRFKESEIINRW